MAECIKCESSRIATVNGKTSDLNNVQLGDHVHDGYVPDDMNLSADGGEDNINFDLCLDCGTIQAEWPVPETKLERDESYM